jgi:hypothetical protein
VPSSSDQESNDADDEVNLLPQVFTDYEPRDNQSSDYDGNEDHDDDEVSEESSVANSKKEPLKK